MVQKLKITLFALCCLFSMEALAQDPHWGEVDPHAYHYDMSFFVALQTPDGEAITDFSDYEIAGFMNNECRGVATFLTATNQITGESGTYGYLRVRSDKEEEFGKPVTFKVYVKSTKSEIEVKSMVLNGKEQQQIAFEHQAAVGEPGNPLMLTIEPFIPGDVDGNGKIEIFDAVAIVDYILYGTDINLKAADVTNEGEVTIFDAVAIVDIILNNQ